MSSIIPQAIDYQRPLTRVAGNSNRPLQVAFICGLAPTTMGTIALVGWLLTHYGGFEAVGLFTMLGGLVLLPIGIAAAAWHLWSSYRTKRTPVREWLVPGILSLAILLGNLPLSAAYIRVYDSIANRFTVRVVNGTAAAASVVITDPSGQQMPIGPVPPGQTAQRWFIPRGEGSINLTTASLPQPVVVEPYFSSGLGNGPVIRTVTFGANGTVSVN